MPGEQKNQLTRNIGEGLAHATKSVQERMLNQFAAADVDYAARVKKAITMFA